MVIDFYVKSIQAVASIPMTSTKDPIMRLNLNISAKDGTSVTMEVGASQINLSFEKLLVLEELIKSAKRQETNARKMLVKQEKEIK